MEGESKAVSQGMSLLEAGTYCIWLFAMLSLVGHRTSVECHACYGSSFTVSIAAEAEIYTNISEPQLVFFPVDVVPSVDLAFTRTLTNMTLRGFKSITSVEHGM